MADEALSRRDEEKLAELGYKQDLDRGVDARSRTSRSRSRSSRCWRGASPPTARPSTTADRSRSPGAGRSSARSSSRWRSRMSELASAYPTAGGPVLVGGQARRSRLVLVHGLVQPHRALRYRRLGRLRPARRSRRTVFNLWDLNIIVNFSGTPELDEIFILFLVILGLHALINIYSSHLVALFNNISVGGTASASR